MKKPRSPNQAGSTVEVAGFIEVPFDLEGKGPAFSDDLVAWLATRPEAHSWEWEECPAGLPPSLPRDPKPKPEPSTPLQGEGELERELEEDGEVGPAIMTASAPPKKRRPGRPKG